MKTSKKLIGMLILALCLLAAIPVSAMAATKGYTILSGNTQVYSNTGLTSKYGTIYGSDEVTINTITNSYVKVTYPISGGRTKTGYVRVNTFFTTTSGTNYTAKAKTTTYRRPGGASYGYVAAGDRVLVLGKSGNYTQVRYPVSGGYKYAFVTTSDLNSKIIGNNDNYVNISNGTYTFTSAVKSNMVMDVSGAKSANGTNIQIWQSNGGGNQKFTVTSLGSGWYKIICAANNKSIDVAGGSSASGTNVQLYDYNGSAAQQWKFYSAGNGYYYIKNRLGNYLDVNGGYSSNGTNVQVWTGNSTVAQKWKLTAATYTPPVTIKTYYVTTSAGLILRSKASTLSTKLTVMPYASAFSVSSVSGGWAYGTYGGKTGYASTQYLSTTKPSRINLSQALYNSSSARITCGFDGYTSTSGRHEGIDISWYLGAPIYALADGVITRVAYGYNGKNGLSTIAVYNSTYNKTIIYLHSAPVSGLYAGKTITKGTKIGTQAWRGVTSSSGSHTHVEVRDGRQTYASKSLNDWRLDNPNPTAFWNSLGYNVR